MSLKIRIGCQTYTWEMLGEKWKGRVDDILDAIASAGYEGVEISNNMIGNYYQETERFKEALEKRNLTLAAFAYGTPYGFSESKYWQEELEGTRKALEFVKHFPESVLCLAGAANPNNKENRKGKLSNACKFYNEVGRLGKAMGIMVTFHPHSHHGSLIEKAKDYEQLMNETLPGVVSWNPDTGHIHRGGEDLLGLLGKYKLRIKHIHLKDTTKEGKWMLLGKGICDFTRMFEFLNEIDYTAWIILEEESDVARDNIGGAIQENLRYVKSLIN